MRHPLTFASALCLLASSPVSSQSAGRGSITGTGLQFVRKNTQGTEEYLHLRSGITLVLVPAGTFTAGVASPADQRVVGDEEDEEHRGQVDEHPHRVKLTRAFLLGKTEVTNAQFRAFRRTHSSGKFALESLDEPNQPVARVSWEDAKAFCDSTGLRLPTEAEWELVARAGDGRPFPWGQTWPPHQGVGNLGLATDGYKAAAPVGSFPANPYGLHDLEGNASEWCADPFGPYPQGESLDPRGPASSRERVFRGGNWAGYSRNDARCANRDRSSPGYRREWIGFRVALSVPTR